MTQTIIDTILDYIDAGLSVIPTDITTKAPQNHYLPNLGTGATWHPFTKAIVAKDEAVRWFSDRNCMPAIIGGKVSGGLEIIDVDNHFGDADKMFQELRELTQSFSAELWDKLVIETTQRGGYHLFYRCSAPTGNSKLAQRLNSKKRNDTLIEIKGEGGYVLCDPATNYTVIQGDLTNINMITDDEREFLLSACQSFNEVVTSSNHYDENYTSNTQADRPGNDFNLRGDHHNLLIETGWKLVYRRGGKEYWRRPDKKVGISATFNHVPDKLYVWSPNAYPFEERKAYDKFAIYSLLKHNGNFSDAAKDLLKQGFGKAMPKSSKKKDKDNNIVFWYEVNTGSEAEPKFELRLELNKIIEFIESLGITKVEIDTNVFNYVRIVKNIATEYTPETILDLVQNHVKKLDMKVTEHCTKTELWELIINKISKLRKKEFLELITATKVEFLRDTKTESYVPFLNGIVKVTANHYEMLDYADVHKVIWDKHIIRRKLNLMDFDFIADTSNSKIAQFFERVCTPANKDFPDDRSKRVPDTDRFMSLLSAIGYMLHAYKDPANPKAIILCEEQIADSNEANGRTGKGLTVHAIRKVRNECYFNGKSINFQNTFFFQNINQDTHYLFFDDVRKNFDFESLFSILTHGITVEKKGKTPVFIPYEHSPKIIIATNSVISNDSPSHKARKHEIEFSDYYSDEYSPVDDFKEMFFEAGWQPDNPEWDKFYSFMLFTIAFYLDSGLMKYQQVNLDYRKLIDQVPEEFLDFAQQYIVKMKDEGFVSSEELYENFMNISVQFGNKSKNSKSKKVISTWFGKMLKYEKIKYENKTNRVDGTVKRGFSNKNITQQLVDEPF